MITKKQLKIFGLFGDNIFEELSFSEIKKALNEQSNSLIQDAIRAFLEENIITQRKKGNLRLYRINPENDKAFFYLEMFFVENMKRPVARSISIIKKSLNKENLFYSLIIFGSYAKKKHTKSSDLDVCILVPASSIKKPTEIALTSASNKTPINTDIHIITQRDFIEMLSADYENLGKQIAAVNLPVYNASIFYRLLTNQVNYGFRHLH